MATPTLYGPNGQVVLGNPQATNNAPTTPQAPVPTGRVRGVRSNPALPPLHSGAVWVGPPWPGRRYGAATKAAYVVHTYYKVGATFGAIVAYAAANPHPVWGNLAGYTAACLQYDYVNNPNSFTL